MSNVSVQVITAETEDNLTGIVMDDVPHLYWLRIYRALGLSPSHARKVIERLEEGKHFISFSRREFKEKYPTMSKLDTVIDNHASRVIFINTEGYHRAIMEIETGYIKNPVVAEAVNSKKNHMASIYTRYQQGETLSKATDETPALPGEVTHPEYAPVAIVLEDQIAISRIMIGEGVEPGIAKAMAFSVTEEITHCGDVLTPWKNLIETDPLLQEPATLTPTDIGIALGGKSPIEINKTLVRLGYQRKIGKEWTPTTSGKLYARYVPQEIKHDRGIVRHMQLRWLPSIVEKIRSSIYYQQQGQTGLFLGEVVG
ncbi:MAG TPA: hypothetical protein VN429_02765 [Methanospirillum sp.]|uniref:hypothetical protein n=1 Tax=Methanospirillum sp. TaxID=45200 RepID=UPI002C54ED5B|nr:hypothetical protein [Methanospirillum sp.]HWQ63312.1 hypothetical protein [Methanospirillum sp.]